MIIEPNTSMILYKVYNFENYDFIEEHLKIIKENGYVWIFKSGRAAQTKKIEKIIKDGGIIILKTGKRAGDKFYIGTFDKAMNWMPGVSEKYPEYYKQYMMENGQGGQWFRVIKIQELQEKNIDLLEVKSNGNKIRNVVDKSRTPFIYVKNSGKIEI